MLFNLVIKEFKCGALFQKIKKANILSFLISLVLLVGFFTLEVSIFQSLSVKLDPYPGAPEGFLTLFLALISVIEIFYLTIVARRSVFARRDLEILSNKPVSPSLNILSKVIFVYLRDLMNNFMVSLPLLLVYGISHGVSPISYLFICLYPFLVSLLETGFASLLVVPCQWIHQFLRRHHIVQIVSAVVMVVAFCFIYYYILNAFLTLVRNNNINAIFSVEFIKSLSDLSQWLVPTRFYVDMLVSNFEKWYWMLIIVVAVFMLGTSVATFAYFRSLGRYSDKRRGTKTYKGIVFDKPYRALIIKEIYLLFGDTSSVFSFTGLLVAEPFLTVLVVNAMDTIFETGILTYVSSYFPYLISLIQILFVSLFASFVNTSSSFVISREGGDGVRICKTIPVSYKKQVLIKMAVPFTFSMLTLFFTISFLLATKEMGLVEGLLAFVLSVVLLTTLQIISVKTDLKKPSFGRIEENSSAVASLISIFLPFIAVAMMFFLCYFGLALPYSFLIVLALLLAILIPFGIHFLKSINRSFLLLEMRN